MFFFFYFVLALLLMWSPESRLIMQTLPKNIIIISIMTTWFCCKEILLTFSLFTFFFFCLSAASSLKHLWLTFVKSSRTENVKFSFFFRYWNYECAKYCSFFAGLKLAARRKEMRLQSQKFKWCFFGVLCDTVFCSHHHQEIRLEGHGGCVTAVQK